MSPPSGARVFGTFRSRAQLLAGDHIVEVVLVDVDGLALLERGRIGALGEVTRDQHLERQFLLGGRPARVGLVDDVDALLGSD